MAKKSRDSETTEVSSLQVGIFFLFLVYIPGSLWLAKNLADDLLFKKSGLVLWTTSIPEEKLEVNKEKPSLP